MISNTLKLKLYNQQSVITKVIETSKDTSRVSVNRSPNAIQTTSDLKGTSPRINLIKRDNGLLFPHLRIKSVMPVGRTI